MYFSCLSSFQAVFMGMLWACWAATIIISADRSLLQLHPLIQDGKVRNWNYLCHAANQAAACVKQTAMLGTGRRISIT